MMIKTIVLLVMFASTAYAQGGDHIFTLLPLHSTRTEVEKLFGAPRSVGGSTYETKDEMITFWFSEGRCLETKSAIWDVSKDTVVGVLVSPKNKMEKLALMNRFKAHKFTSTQERPGVTVYYNSDGSIKFETKVIGGEEDVVFFALAPRLADSHLKCKCDEKQ